MYIVIQNGGPYNAHDSGYSNKQDKNKGNKKEKRRKTINYYVFRGNTFESILDNLNVSITVQRDST